MRNIFTHFSVHFGRWVAIVALALLLAAGLYVFRTFPTTPGKTSQKPTQECAAKLDDRLYRLLEVPNPVAYAQAQGLYTRDGFVRVVITVTDARTALPMGYTARVEAHADQLVQALVRVSELCALAREPAVVNIAPPQEAQPLMK